MKRSFCLVSGILFAAAACAAEETVASGESTRTLIDTRAGDGVALEAKASEPIRYSSLWAADANATATVTLNGVPFAGGKGEGVAEWTPTANGTYTFQHTTEGSGETLTATFNVTGKDVPHVPNVALGFEEYAQGTELTEGNCPGVTIGDDNTLLCVDPLGGPMGNIDMFTPPFASAGTNCLSVKTTFGKPCSFALKEDKSSVEVSSEKPYYVDFLARFTILEEPPNGVAPYAAQTAGRGMLQGAGMGVIVVRYPGFVCYIDDDIMLWRQEEYDAYYDNVLGTNWWVRAGNGNGGTADYVLTSMGDSSFSVGDDDWYRVTFKACRDEVSGKLFFNIFLNGKQVRAGDTTDFPSMTDRTFIATVRFEGQGNVDNIVSYETPSVCIRNVTAKQRWPWNGKVDITYEVVGDIAAGLPSWNVPVLVVSATNRVAVTNYVADVAAISGDTGTSEGIHHVVWDLNVQGLEFVSDDVVFTVAYNYYPKYCVVDLSAGSASPSYPVSYLADVPEDGWTDEYKTAKLALRLIEPGTFKMCEAYNETLLELYGGYVVTLSKPYYIGVFEVTQKQYELVLGDNPSSFLGDMRPVESVSWNMVRGNSSTYDWPNVVNVDPDSFMGRLQVRTELRFDLPTEAQWEYACRAGSHFYYNGWASEDGLKQFGRYSGNLDDGRGGYSDAHTTVGAYRPNSWGLYDMHGNVCEWCLDWYDDLSNGITDPTGPYSGTYKVLRGGCWVYNAKGCTSSSRILDVPERNDNTGYGFRLVRILSNTDIKYGLASICAADSGTVSIDSRVAVPFATGDVMVNGWSGKYDGLAHGVDVAVREGIGDVSFLYASGALGTSRPTGEWSTVAPALTDVGSMTVWCEISAPGYITQTNSATVTITKATNEWITEPSIAGWTYGDTPNEPNMGVAKFGAATVAYGALGAARPTEVGEYVATFTVAGTGNYEGLSLPVEFSIDKATVGPGGGKEPGDSEVSVGGESKFDVMVMYDGESHTIDTNALMEAFAAAMVGDVVAEYALDDGSGEVGHAGRVTLPWLVEPPVYTNVGEYVVWYRVTNPNYEDFVHAAKVTITNRPVTVTVTGHTAEHVYDGSEKYVEGFDLAADDQLYDFNAKTYFGGVSFSAKRTDVGTSYMGLAASQFENGDKNFSVTYVVTDGWLRITQATNEWVVKPSILGWVYGQQPNEPSMGAAQFGTATVAYGALGAARPTEVGSYVATFTVAGTDNYTWLVEEVPFAIASAEGTKLQEIFDGLSAVVESDGNGGWKVTITNDVDLSEGPIEIPDNIGNVTIDLNGHDLVGDDGHDGHDGACPSQDGKPAIRIVKGEGDGEPTVLTIVNSGGDATVKGGDGGAGNPGGSGAPAIEIAEGTQDGVLINIGEGVTVQGGVGGVSEDGAEGVSSPGIVGEIGTNEGIVLPFALTEEMVDEIAPQPFTGEAVTPEVQVFDAARNHTLEEGTDYVLNWANNIRPGTVSVTVTGKGNYLGEVTRTFTIGTPVEVTLKVGEYFKATLAELGYDVPTNGTPYAVAAKGLPAGLKLKYNPAWKDKKGKVVIKAKSEWWIEGVPTAAMDFFENPPYLVITVGGVAGVHALPIEVLAQEVTELEDLALGQLVNEQFYLPGVTNGWTVSGLPTGLKYTAKRITEKLKSGKQTKTVTKALPYSVYGKTTKAGLFTITAKKKAGAFYETMKYRVLVRPKAVDTAVFGEELTNIVTMAYVPVAWDLTGGSRTPARAPASRAACGWGIPVATEINGHAGRVPLPMVTNVAKVTGLPTGVTFAAKDTYKDKKKTQVKQYGQTIVGTPTKPGTYVVTFTKNVTTGTGKNKKTVAKTAQILWTVVANDTELKLGFNTAGGVVESGVVGLKYGDLMAFTATSNATVTASGLPAGMKLVKLDEGGSRPVATEPGGSRSLATEPGGSRPLATESGTDATGRVPPVWWGFEGFTAKAGTYLVTVKATLNGKTVTQRVALKVEGLPAWAKGTFNGIVTGNGEQGTGNGEQGTGGSRPVATNGLATITVSSAGKISGKFSENGMNWTFTAASFDGVRRDGVIAPYQAAVPGTRDACPYQGGSRPLATEAFIASNVVAKYTYKVKEKVKGKTKTVTKTLTRSFTLTVAPVPVVPDVADVPVRGYATMIETDATGGSRPLATETGGSRTPARAPASRAACGCGIPVATEIEAWQNLWGSAYKALGKALFTTKSGKKTLAYRTFTYKGGDDGDGHAGRVPLPEGTTLSMKVTTAGAATATLTFDTGRTKKDPKTKKTVKVVYKATCQSVVIPGSAPDSDVFDGFVPLYFAPSAADGFPGFADYVQL